MPTPQTSYEITKLIGDQVINKAKIKSTILRCGPIIFQNNNNNIISKLIRVAKYKVNIKINTLIYATHILELMEAIDIIEKKKLYGTQIVVNCYDIREIQDLINKKFSLNINVDLINFLIKILNKISFEIVPKKIINYNNKTLYKNSINDNKCVSRVVNDSRK